MEREWSGFGRRIVENGVKSSSPVERLKKKKKTESSHISVIICFI